MAVAVTAPDYPHCGGVLEAAGEETVWLTKLPAPAPPVTRAFQVQACRCRDCGKSRTYSGC